MPDGYPRRLCDPLLVRGCWSGYRGLAESQNCGPAHLRNLELIQFLVPARRRRCRVHRPGGRPSKFKGLTPSALLPVRFAPPLNHVVCDPSPGSNLDAMGFGPGSDFRVVVVLRMTGGRTACALCGATIGASPDLPARFEVGAKCPSQLVGVSLREIDFVVRSLQGEGDRLGCFATVEIINHRYRHFFKACHSHAPLVANTGRYDHIKLHIKETRLSSIHRASADGCRLRQTSTTSTCESQL